MNLYLDSKLFVKLFSALQMAAAIEDHSSNFSIEEELKQYDKTIFPQKLAQLEQSKKNLDQLVLYCRNFYATPDLPREQYLKNAEQATQLCVQSIQSLAIQITQCAQAFTDCFSAQNSLVDEQHQGIQTMSTVTSS
jgi:hypothetical protein